MSFKPFGVVLRELLIERGVTTKVGNPSWTRFASSLKTMQYETLRKAVAGERRPTSQLMQEAAEALGVDPAEVFAEYRLWAARREFDPSEVGVARAMTMLEVWEAFVAAHADDGLRP